MHVCTKTVSYAHEANENVSGVVTPQKLSWMLLLSHTSVVVPAAGAASADVTGRACRKYVAAGDGPFDVQWLPERRFELDALGAQALHFGLAQAGDVAAVGGHVGLRHSPPGAAAILVALCATVDVTSPVPLSKVNSSAAHCPDTTPSPKP